MARPKKYDDEVVRELVEKFRVYIDGTDIPIVAEFAYLNEVERTFLYDKKEFSTLLKKCIAKKEAQLERKSLIGEVNTTQAIFSLKQLGWRDKQEVEHSGETTQNVNNKHDLSKLSVEELKNIETILSKTSDTE